MNRNTANIDSNPLTNNYDNPSVDLYKELVILYTNIWSELIKNNLHYAKLYLVNASQLAPLAFNGINWWNNWGGLSPLFKVVFPVAPNALPQPLVP